MKISHAVMYLWEKCIEKDLLRTQNLVLLEMCATC